MVRLDQDQNLLLTLAPETSRPAPAPIAPASEGPAATKAGAKRDAAAPPTPNPEGAFVHKPRDGKPARPIDNADPYGP